MRKTTHTLSFKIHSENEAKLDVSSKAITFFKIPMPVIQKVYTYY